MKHVEIKKNFGGLTKLQEALHVLQVKRVHVGIFGNKTGRSQGSDKTNAEIGFKHEFGDGRTPMRSFLRMPIDYKGKSIFKEARLSVKYLADKNGAFTFLERVGAAAFNAVQEAFNTRGFGTWAPNAYSTVMAKLRRLRHLSLQQRRQLAGEVVGEGADHTQVLVETGQLRRAVAWRVVGCFAGFMLLAGCASLPDLDHEEHERKREDLRIEMGLAVVRSRLNEALDRLAVLEGSLSKVSKDHDFERAARKAMLETNKAYEETIKRLVAPGGAR